MIGIIVQVSIGIIVLKFWVVRIGIRAVTTAIDITIDATVNADSITTKDITCNIVTTIYVIDVASSNQHTSRITGRERSSFDSFLRNGFLSLVRINIGHTASAIDIVHLHAFRFYSNVNAVWMSHCTLVTTTIKISNLAAFQVPGRTDGHLCLIVTAKHTANLVGIARWAREGGVDSHQFETVGGQQFALIFCRDFGIFDTVDHFAGVVQANNGLVCYCSVVTTTIGIDNRTAKDFQIGLIEFGF